MKTLFAWLLIGMIAVGSAVRAGEPGGGPSLCEAAKPYFRLGAAVTSKQVQDPAMSALIVRQFDCLTAEFEFMPQFLEPEPGHFTFERADKIAAFAQANHLPLTGHMLCWHQLTPQWMFADRSGKPLPRATALANLKIYIGTVVRHFHRTVDSWNVVNEAISDDAGQWLRDTPARRAIGDDYIEKAFEFAHEADPDAELYYNDYNIEDPQKLSKTLKLIRQLQDHKVRLDSVGIQGHWLLDYPAVTVVEAGITAVAKTGVKVRITELDVDVLPRKPGADLNATPDRADDPYAEGATARVLKKQAARYAELFAVFKKHHGEISSVTFWGVHDGQSWLNDFPVKGRTNHPLLFDRQLKAKPAFDAVMETLRNP
jgi:endo-1,4-beta-xylanase